MATEKEPGKPDVRSDELHDYLVTWLDEHDERPSDYLEKIRSLNKNEKAAFKEYCETEQPDFSEAEAQDIADDMEVVAESTSGRGFTARDDYSGGYYDFFEGSVSGWTDDEYDLLWDTDLARSIFERLPNAEVEEEWWDRKDESHPDLEWAKEGTRYSIAQASNGDLFALLDRQDGIDWNDREAVAKHLATLVGSGAVSLADGKRVLIGKDMPKEYTRSTYAEKAFRNKRLRKLRGKAAQHLDELIAVSGEREQETAQHKQREGGKYYRRFVDFGVAGHEKARGYSGELITYEQEGTEYLYDLVGIEDNPALSSAIGAGSHGGYEILSANTGVGLTPAILPQAPGSVNPVSRDGHSPK